VAHTLLILFATVPVVIVIGPICILYFVLARRGMRMLSDWAAYLLCCSTMVVEYFYIQFGV
jgi:hypothetical protein